MKLKCGVHARLLTITTHDFMCYPLTTENPVLYSII